jgi:hypothetical protein
MASSITLFSGYDQKENRTTNYCLLVLRMLYEENPKLFSQAISWLTNETAGGSVGVEFFQQQKRRESIPDGVIKQKAFTIFIETKRYDWFYDDQLERHLGELNQEPGLKILIALGNFEQLLANRFERIEHLCETKYMGAIVFAAVSFEEFVQKIEELPLPKNLADTVADLRAYLDGTGLLPSWSNYLDVVNCATMYREILDGNVYLCPATGGHYNHRRCRFFGMYREKCVSLVALIRSVVDVTNPTSATIRWKNTDDTNDDLIKLATAAVQRFRPDRYPVRVFVLEQPVKTSFTKDTKGGMLGSKQYFDISHLNAKSAEELAQKLQGKTWSNYRNDLS